MNTLLQALPSGALDIVGDIHGELDALNDLLSVLGYSNDGSHPQNRTLVFIGDFCDRGPNSPGVIYRVQELMENRNAVAILGNHEVNLLANDAKDGSGWYFESRYDSDLPYYAPFTTVTAQEKPDIINFLNDLPIALERHDLRVVHASWHASSIDKIRRLPVGRLGQLVAEWEAKVQIEAERSGLLERYQYEKEHWKVEIESEDNPPPFLHGIAEYEALQHVHNPFKVLTSGLEATTRTPFFSGNRWRFSDRLPWWDDYAGGVPVVIGHYWRLFEPRQGQPQSRYSQLFRNVGSRAWHGKNHDVFCVDYSVGARWRNRRASTRQAQRFRLAALQWPEMRLVFDDGDVHSTENRPQP